MSRGTDDAGALVVQGIENAPDQDRIARHEVAHHALEPVRSVRVARRFLRMKLQDVPVPVCHEYGCDPHERQDVATEVGNYNGRRVGKTFSEDLRKVLVVAVEGDEEIEAGCFPEALQGAEGTRPTVDVEQVKHNGGLDIGVPWEPSDLACNSSVLVLDAGERALGARSAEACSQAGMPARASVTTVSRWATL